MLKSRVVKLYRSLRLFFLVALACLLIVSCHYAPAGQVVSDNQTNSSCQLIQHEIGKTQICSQPQTVAALSPPLLDMMLSLGVQPSAYASVDAFNQRVFDRPSKQILYLGEYITTKPVNLGDRITPSTELLLRLKPDLILGEEYHQAHYNLLSRIAPTLLFSTIGAGGWKQVIPTIGKALGREQQVQQVIASYDQQLAQTRAVLAPIVAQQQVLVIGFDRAMSNSFLLNHEDFIGGLLQDLGFRVVNLDTEQSRYNISLEVLPQIKSDLIIVAPTGDNTIENAQQQWSQNPILRSLPAVQNQQVYFIDYQFERIRGPIAAKILINRVRELFLDK